MGYVAAVWGHTHVLPLKTSFVFLYKQNRSLTMSDVTQQYQSICTFKMLRFMLRKGCSLFLTHNFNGRVRCLCFYYFNSGESKVGRGFLFPIHMMRNHANVTSSFTWLCETVVVFLRCMLSPPHSHTPESTACRLSSDSELCFSSEDMWECYRMSSDKVITKSRQITVWNLHLS